MFNPKFSKPPESRVVEVFAFRRERSGSAPRLVEFNSSYQLHATVATTIHLGASRKNGHRHPAASNLKDNKCCSRDLI